MQQNSLPNGDIIQEVSSYIATCMDAALPSKVIEKAKHHILDSLAAIVSGSNLRPGRLAKEFARNQGGVAEAQIATSQVVTSAINAAFANGMMAHADETDDSHTKTLVHPGSSVVPAALAISEREGADGMSFLKGVVVGYDIGCKIIQALIPNKLLHGSGATPSIGGSFGAAAAAAAILRLDKDQIRFVLSYAAQQASGVNFWMRDEGHCEKAFVFGGMPARNGAAAAVMVQSGFTGVRDSFSGEHNFFNAFSDEPIPQLLVDGLGAQYEIMFTDMKKFSVGFPIQAPLDALLLLIERHGLSARNVKSIVAHLPAPGVHTVNNRDMPNINLQYILAVTLLDGHLTFRAAHSFERMNDPAVLEIKKRIKLVEAFDLTAAKLTRHGIVEVITEDGTQINEHALSRGTVENPMTTEEVEKKCRELLIPVLGIDRSEALIDNIWNLEKIKNMQALRPLLAERL